MRKIIWIAAGVLVLFAGRADALLYLAGKSLESMLVRSDLVTIATAEEVDGDSATLKVSDVLKGTAEGTVKVHGVNLRITSDKTRARFAKGDTVVAFLVETAKGTLAIEHTQVLATDAEVKTMKACITEVLPYAGTLNDLANPKQEVKDEKVVEAVAKLEASRNGYTQVAMGRWMRSVLAARVEPELCTDQIVDAIATGRTELKIGAMISAQKYEMLPVAVREALEKAARETKEKSVLEMVHQVLDAAQKKAPQTRPGA